MLSLLEYTLSEIRCFSFFGIIKYLSNKRFIDNFPTNNALEAYSETWFIVNTN